MNLRALRTLVEIDRVGSFATVAERLGMTLSAVSVQMRTLEEELQFPLFDRRHRPPAMTPAAREVAAYARRILAEVEELRAMGEEPGVLKGQIRIGFVATASVRLLPAFLVAAAARQPKAHFTVESGVSADLTRRVATGDLDAAVVTESPDLPPALSTQVLREEVFALAAPAKARGWTLQRCAAALPFIRFLPSTGIGLLVDRYLQAHAGTVRETVTLDSVEAVMGCVNAGLGFAVLPKPDAARYAARAAVSQLADPPLTRRLSLVAAAEGPNTAAAAVLASLFDSD
ncbi:MAG: LysR family transcriptional regulator [Pseudomonadota bacterium]